MNNINNTSEKIFHDLNYDNYIVQYQGDILSEFKNDPNNYVTIINSNYAIVSLKKGDSIVINDKRYPSIVYVRPVTMYSLQDISPLSASQVEFLQTGSELKLTGVNTLIGTVDSGIDYLNEEFIDANGNTRIECIWDQTIISDENKKIIGENKVPFGTIYTEEDINNAIKAKLSGKNPYDIVPSVDTIGHGTKMAGIMGANGKNPQLRGVVPECKFVVVKLIEDYSFQNEYKVTIPVFNITSLFAALQFLYEYTLNGIKPMTIYFPLGSNSGNHRGNGILEEYIETILNNKGIVIVTGTGNERNEGSHASGIVNNVGETSVVELDVSPEQKDLYLEIWIDLPNIMTLDVISPSGESSGEMLAIINFTETHTYVFEQTKMSVNFYLPEENSGYELIRITFHELKPGIWKLRLRGNYILSGVYNVWIPVKGITLGNTHFTPSDPYGTITNPGSTDSIITVAAYDQNNNNLLSYSGMAFADQNEVVNLAAGGVNALTTAPNNETAVVSGTSVAAAIVAGVCSMLFQWGVVDGNNPSIYSQTMKTYLIRGTSKRQGDIYPNPQLGYGILNVIGIFENMT